MRFNLTPHLLARLHTHWGIKVFCFGQKPGLRRICRLRPAFHKCRKILRRKKGKRNLQDSQSRVYFPNISNFQKLKWVSGVLDTRERKKKKNPLVSTCILLRSLTFREVQAREHLLPASSVGQQYRQSRSEMRGY